MAPRPQNGWVDLRKSKALQDAISLLQINHGVRRDLDSYRLARADEVHQAAAIMRYWSIIQLWAPLCEAAVSSVRWAAHAGWER
jgi:hypothetical protein